MSNTVEPFPKPTAPTARIELLDILRGFALLGILLVNFAGGRGETLGAMDTAVQRSLDVLVRNSFYPLFAFLFGAGFALQSRNARANRRGFGGFFLRRMAVLFLFGTAHSVLIWSGDILVDYAIIGMLMIPVHRLPITLTTGVVGLMVAMAMIREPLASATQPQLAGKDDEVAATLARGMRDEQRTLLFDQYASDSPGFLGDVRARRAQYAVRVSSYASPIHLLNRDILLLFLIGCLAAKLGWLDGGRRRKQTLLIGAGIGVIATSVGFGYGTIATGAPHPAVTWMMRTATNYGVTAAYIGMIGTAVSAHGRVAEWLKRLSPVGRMALTNYLTQSLVMTWLFLPYGFGLARPTASVFVLLNIAFFSLIQVPFSEWWLQRFRFGPAEWLWRSLAYGALQPMRGRPPSLADVEVVKPVRGGLLMR